MLFVSLVLNAFRMLFTTLLVLSLTSSFTWILKSCEMNLVAKYLGEMAKISKIFTFIKVGSVLGTPKTPEGGSKC